MRAVGQNFATIYSRNEFSNIRHKTFVGCSKCGFFPRCSGFPHLLLLVDKFY
jgi:hypothetical protein